MVGGKEDGRHNVLIGKMLCYREGEGIEFPIFFFFNDTATTEIYTY